MWPAAPTRGARVLLWVLGFPVLRASTCTCSSQRFHHLLLLVLQEASGIRDLLRDQGSILGTSKSSKPWIQLWIQQPRIQLWISQTPYPQQTLASTRGDASRDASPHLLHSLRPSPPPHTHTHTLPRSMESPPPYLEPAVSSGEAGGSNLTSGGSAEPALQLWVQYNRLPPCPQLSGYPLSIHPSHHFCPSEAGCKHS